jgi:hypothetical protein
MDDSPFLFSAAMVARQNLMSDIQVGRVKTIRTDEYIIVGEPSERLVVFAIGEFELNLALINFLKKVGSTIESLIEPDDKLMEFSSTVYNMIEVMIDQFVKVWGGFKSHTGILIDKEKLGFQYVTDQYDQQASLLITGYINALPSIYREKSHTFYDILPSGGSILCLMITYSNTRIIIYMYIEDLDLKVVISNKHTFINKTFEFINEFGLSIVEEEKISVQIEDAWEKYNTELRESFVQYDLDYEFLQSNSILDRFNDYLPKILDELIRGKPVAIITSDEHADQLINLIMHITGSISGSTYFAEDQPKRIIKCTYRDIQKVRALNYLVFNLDVAEAGRVGGKYSFFSEAWGRIYSPDRPVSDIIFDLRQEMMNIWDICIGILIQFIFGQNPQIIFDSLPKEEYIQLFRDIMSWINPYVLESTDEVRIISENKDNW